MGFIFLIPEAKGLGKVLSLRNGAEVLEADCPGSGPGTLAATSDCLGREEAKASWGRRNRCGRIHRTRRLGPYDMPRPCPSQSIQWNHLEHVREPPTRVRQELLSLPRQNEDNRNVPKRKAP